MGKTGATNDDLPQNTCFGVNAKSMFRHVKTSFIRELQEDTDADH